MNYVGGVTPQRLVLFMLRLTKGAKRKVVLILDNLNVHTSRMDKDWLVTNAKQIEMSHLQSTPGQLQLTIRQARHTITAEQAALTEFLR